MYSNTGGSPAPTWSPPPIQAPVPQHPQRPMQFGSAANSYPNSPQPVHQQPQQRMPSRQQQQQHQHQQQQSSYGASPFPPAPNNTQPAYAVQAYHRPAPQPQHQQQQQPYQPGAEYGGAGYGASQGNMGGGGAYDASGYPAQGVGMMGQGQMGMGAMGSAAGQQQWGSNLINEFQTSAAGQLGMQLGGKAFEQAQENLNKNLNRWVNIPHLKYYFNVSNSYVLNKIRLLFFPFRHQSWIRLVRRSEHSGQAEGYEPPRRDLNAPDLYIPVMTFVTYILLVGIRLGLNDANAAGKVDPSQGINPAKVIKSFSPDVLGMTGTTAFFIVFFEVLFFKLGFYLLNVTTDVPFLDLVSYSGYKFLGVISAMVAKIISPITWPVYVVLGYTMLCLGFFTLRSLKYIILPEGYSTLEPSARQRRVQFLFLVSAVQIFLSSVMVIWS